MSGARPDTWMPLYIGDYLADTMHLNNAQHGIYLLLIMAYWRNGGALPEDEGQLSSIAKCAPSEWRRHLPVISKFFHIADGLWSHKRIDAELAGAIDLVEDRREAGRRGGLAARGKSGRPRKNSSAISEPLQNGTVDNIKTMANEWQKNTPSPSPSHIVRKREREARATPASPASLSQDFKILEEWKEKARSQRAEAGLPEVNMTGEALAFLNRATGPPILGEWLNWALKARAPSPNANGKVHAEHDGESGKRSRPTGPPPPILDAN